jgi:hypothetical protein
MSGKNEEQKRSSTQAKKKKRQSHLLQRRAKGERSDAMGVRTMERKTITKLGDYQLPPWTHARRDQ